MNLLIAASEGRTARIRCLLRQHPDDINYMDDNGPTPLHFAVSFDHATSVRVLLEAGADYTIASPLSGEHPLHVAVTRFYPIGLRSRLRAHDIIRRLLKPEIIHVPDAFGMTPLMRAAQNKNVFAVRQLLRHRANPCFSNNMGTSLHYAASIDKNLTIIKALIRSRVGVDTPNRRENMTALGTAIVNGCLTNFNSMVTDPRILSNFRWAGTKTNTGAHINYGHLAAISDEPDIMENLFYFGLPTDERCSFGNHILHYAASQNSDRCIVRFWDLQQGQERLALPINSEGRTPLHLLAFNSTNDALNTPEQEAKDIESLICFLRGHPFLNGRDFSGRTVLHYAAWSNRANMVRLLLERGADRTISDSQGMIPLQYTGQDSLIAELLRGTYPGLPSPGPSTPAPANDAVPDAAPPNDAAVPVIIADMQADEKLPPSPLVQMIIPDKIPDGFQIDFCYDSDFSDTNDPLS